MKVIPVALQAHIAQSATTIATCWRVTLVNGTVLGFTDHDKDLVVSSVLYRSSSGYTATDVASGLNLDVDNLEVIGMLNSPSITDDDLRAGLWDHAEVKIFQVNWANVAMGSINLRIGHIGQVTAGKNVFRAELLGLTQAYAKSIGEITSPGCRAILGDVRCGVNLASGGSPQLFTQFGSVDIFNPVTLVITDTAVSFPTSVGQITFTSGANFGLTFEGKSHVAGVSTTLQLPPPYTVAPGDTYTAIIRCDKKIRTCIDVFHNVENFRGEPYLQGLDKLGAVGRRS